ncbi:MAG TPA: DUF4124 domain-containing protein [Telluria sp.]|nr:DUF4124 domain-containing protein [Telluria sp.]
MKLRLAITAALLLAASLAHAQYVWKDNKGIRHYSDRAPPPDVPTKDIIQAPNLSALDLQLPDAPAQPQAQAAAKAQPAPKGPPTLAEREMDFRKRQEERAEQEKKDALEAQNAKARQEQCDAARAAKQQYDSGARLGKVNAFGEREFMNDIERAKNAVRAAEIVAGCR